MMFQCPNKSFPKRLKIFGFHSITKVALAERLHGTPDEDWEALAGAHADLLRWKPSVIDDYYSAARLWSDQARAQFLLPDRVPAPSSHATV